MNAKKTELLQKVLDGKPINEIEERLEILERSYTIRERLMDAFPGYFRGIMNLKFGQFLGEPIMTLDQEKAYHKIQKFLDEVEPLRYPEDVQIALDDANQVMTDGRIAEMNQIQQDAYNDFDTYFADNEELLK